MAYNTHAQIFSHNCQGINTCINELVDEMKTSDIGFICEHWLRPCEIPALKKALKEAGLWSCLKSSINPEEVLIGRPYGGVGFVCKPMTGIEFRPFEVDCDRIMCIQLINNNRVKLNVIGVYMPYYNGTADQIALYSETLDILQSVIDQCTDAPVVIVGDMNAQLPQHNRLNRNWYRTSPFTPHSMLLYDFLSNNDMFVGNFAFTQNVNYTYMKANYRSYIDHVFLPRYVFDNLVNCKIVENTVDHEWSSDHLPIRTEYKLTLEASDSANVDVSHLNNVPKFLNVKWDDDHIRLNYEHYVVSGLQNVPWSHINEISPEDAQGYVDKQCDTLIQIMLDSSEKSMPQRESNYQGVHKKVPWWNYDCTVARDRMRFWRNLWWMCDKVRHGVVYNCYKNTKKLYRQIRRQAISNMHQSRYDLITNLFSCKTSKQFWNRVRMSKDKTTQSADKIDIITLANFYKEKFSEQNRQKTDTIKQAELDVMRKYDDIQSQVDTNYVFSTEKVVKYIQKLRRGAAPGCDGITAEHLKFSINSDLPSYLSNVLSVCVRFGVLPKSFYLGILVPILKKPTIDPSIAKNYRPVVVSTVLSKLMEMAILDDSSNHDFHDLQFGFVNRRGTNMAICLAHDVVDYFNTRGSPVYTCALDAEMAFDGIPHSILLKKAMNIIPDRWWRILHTWYSKMEVQVKWNQKLSEPFKIEKGTRQGGLTSPFLFNLFYQDLAEGLSNETGGIKVKNMSYNVFIYADDLLLTSATVTGLQKLIMYANKYIIEHGLSFNAKKTTCVTFGKCYVERPAWYLNGTELPTCDELNYLGVVMSRNSYSHQQKRIQACRQGFYGLQGSGLCDRGVTPDIIAHLWKTMLQPVLTYGIQSLPFRKTDVMDMDKLQAKLIKSTLGLSKYCRTSPLLNAMNIPQISKLKDIYCMDLMRCMYLSESRAKQFYHDIIHSKAYDNKYHNLVTRTKAICDSNELSFVRYMLHEQYHKDSRRSLKTVYTQGSDGLTDSVKSLLNRYNAYNKHMLKLLLSPF